MTEDEVPRRNVRIPMAICSAVAQAIVSSGSHKTLNALFEAAGAPGPAPDLSHDAKWKTWLFRAGNDPTVDSLVVLGAIMEKFMDLPPLPQAKMVSSILGETPDPIEEYRQKRERIVTVLENHGLRYFPGGRILPVGEASEVTGNNIRRSSEPQKPESVETLLRTLIRGLPRAMHPLTHRRKNTIALSFDSEYDIQDLLHSQMRPWIADIRPEEYAPSYAGSNARMDFLLPAYRLVIELKRVRTRSHAKEIGNELIIDIEHYRKHPGCERLWCVIYDPGNFLPNPAGLVQDIEGSRSMPDGVVHVQAFVFGSVL